jgi:hypothetical protein
MSNQEQQPTKDTSDTTHISFLLRLWRTGSTGSLNWQASLEIPGTDHRTGFANLEQLFAYLMDLTEGTFCTQRAAEKIGASETGTKS